MPERKVAVVFPGQGSFDGPALLVAHERYPQVAEVLAEIDTVTTELYGRRLSEIVLKPGGMDIAALLTDDPWVSQLAIYATQLAAYRILADRGLRPEVLAGHSLGEIGALVAANAFRPADGARIVAYRVQVLREIGLRGRMVALGADAGRARQFAELIGDPMVAVASENHDGQTVLSGPQDSVGKVLGIARLLGVGAVELNTPFPFHSPMLAAAQPLFAGLVRDLPRKPPEIPVYSPILQRYYTDDDDLAELLAEHFVRPVLFADGVRRLRGEGVTDFVEAGGTDALSKLTRRILGEPDTERFTWPTMALVDGGRLALDETLEVLAGGDQAIAVLAAQLAPGMPAEAFARFWAVARKDVARMVQGKLAEFMVGEFTPVPPVPVAEPAPPVPAPVAVAVAEPASPVPAPATGGADLAAEIRRIYADALEYPEEVFTDDVRLEAELGVDSVKQIELLTRLSEHYGLPQRTKPIRLADYNTMAKIIQFVAEAAVAEAVRK